MGAFLFVCYLIGLPIALLGTARYIWKNHVYGSYWDIDNYTHLALVTIFWPVAVPGGLIIIACTRFFPWLIDVLEPKNRW